nr:aftiphilin isoform X3 [Labrus bergylta]
MEPHIMPLYSSSPPPLDDDDGEAGSEEDEFGDFGGFSLGASCSPPGFVDSSGPPSSLRYSFPSMKPATHQPHCSCSRPVGQSQPTFTGTSGSSKGHNNTEEQNCDAKSPLHLTNGYSERDHNSAASAVDAFSPREETGFADFTVFTEQAAHPWCCGFTPLVGIDEKNFSNSLAEKICDPDQEVIMESEPRSYCKSKAKENICTFQHCEKRDAACVQSSQDQQQPQEAAAAALDFPSEQPLSGEEDIGDPGDQETRGMQKDGESGKDGEDQEKRIHTVTETFSGCESASDVSLYDDWSFEGPSADLEPNVSSLGSPEEQTDWDQTDDEEELENFQHSDPFVNNNTADLRESITGKGSYYFNQSATQETSATSHSGSHSENKCADFKDSGFEHRRDQGRVQTADAGLQILGNLPPSDSFADFCSAPTLEAGEDAWADFKNPEEGTILSRSQEKVNTLEFDGSIEEEQGREGQNGETRRNSCQKSLSDRVQQLLLASFPEMEVPAVEGEVEVLGLGALLHSPESEEEETQPHCSRSQWTQGGMWWQHPDLHSAVGLQFQWGGSHTNTTLLRCLGVDTRNIVYMGMKKRPVAVPAFASSLGMLEPTKDSAPAVCSPGHMVVTTRTSPGPRITSHPSTDSVLEELPSSQLDWSRRGLSSSQDDCSALNLDYFGPEEESTSLNSSSGSNSPPPGVDHELYELTISKLETSITIIHMEDTFNRLMSAAEKTTTLVRKPQKDEELSEEANRVLSGLPNLSFMRAKVLMFPAVLVPKECCSPELQ